MAGIPTIQIYRMSQKDYEKKRRAFYWSDRAKQAIQDWQQRLGKSGAADRKQIIAQLTEISGNPRDACLRFLRRMGGVQKRTYRKWTKPEQQRLVDLIERMPVIEAARILARRVGSVHQMLRRLGLSSRQLREYFTPSLLANALHISRDEIHRWIDRGWLQCRVVQTRGVGIRVIDAEDFCDFINKNGRNVVGRRLTYEGLMFVHNYVVPPKHAELLSVRGPYKRRAAGASEDEGGEAEDTPALDRTA